MTEEEGMPSDTTSQDRARRAKQPATVLAGPKGHPFHPLLVTVPIGAWVASLIFDVVSRQSQAPEAFYQAAYWLIGIGVIGAFVAAVFGLLDMQNIAKGTRAHRTAVMHMTLNSLVVVGFVASWIARLALDATETPLWLLFASVALLGVLAVSGWLGGQLVYRFGVRVIPEQDQLEAFKHKKKRSAA